MIKTGRSIYIIIFFISGCSSFTYNQLSGQVYEAVIGYKYEAIDKSQYIEEKYSFAIAQVGRTNPVKLVLSSVEKNTFKWISADKIIIYTKDGIIIKTEGLLNDFSSDQYTDNMTPLMPSKHHMTFHHPELHYFKRFDSFKYLETKNDYEFFNGEYIKVDIFEYITEAPMIQWNEKNLIYIRSDTNEVIAIEQKFHPHHPPLKLFYYLK